MDSSKRTLPRCVRITTSIRIHCSNYGRIVLAYQKEV
ncbi:hypothetical protein R5R35_012426 [Gryllus longicercus]|uniref:Uncharacterized protein n=1 Tax=Gryllus longicercus TaxID=2509291 RepID=A0AAN9Z6L3_9ORTH